MPAVDGIKSTLPLIEEISNAEVAALTLLISYLISSLSSLEFNLLLPSSIFSLLSHFCHYLLADMAGPTKATMFFKSRKPFTPPTKAMSSRTIPRQSSIASGHDSLEKFSSESSVLSEPPATMPKAAPLSILPLSSIIRSMAITSISSSPVCPLHLLNWTRS